MELFRFVLFSLIDDYVMLLCSLNVEKRAYQDVFKNIFLLVILSERIRKIKLRKMNKKRMKIIHTFLFPSPVVLQLWCNSAARSKEK